MSPARSEARSGPHTTGFIDIGTNSVRLMVVRLEPDRSWNTITLQKEAVRIRRNLASVVVRALRDDTPQRVDTLSRTEVRKVAKMLRSLSLSLIHI